jgi:hypothetical protein
MTKDPRKYAARPPRHCVVDSAAHSVQIAVAGSATSDTCSARLLNFSRQGLRLRCAANLQIGDPVRVQLSDSDGFQHAISGVVKWRGDEADGEQTYGCLFDEEVEWEILGELLLRGVLTSE